jgi:hypothetical protein
MNLEINGKLIIKTDEQTGEGKFGKWIKQEFIIETQEQYPKKICFSAWGDKTDVLKQINIGENISVSFNPESREYNGRWYTDLRVWKISKEGKSSGFEDEPPPLTEDDFPDLDSEDENLPF